MRFRVSVEGWGNALTQAFLTRGEAEEHIARSHELNPHHDISDYVLVEVDEPSRPCKYCGGEIVNDSHPECDFCRGCYYTGTHDTHVHAETCARLSQLMGGSEVTVWHTGGGCMAYGLVTPGGGSILMSSDLSVEGDPDAPEWGYWVAQNEADDAEQNGYGEEPLSLWECAERAWRTALMARPEFEALVTSQV